MLRPAGRTVLWAALGAALAALIFHGFELGGPGALNAGASDPRQDASLRPPTIRAVSASAPAVFQAEPAPPAVDPVRSESIDQVDGEPPVAATQRSARDERVPRDAVAATGSSTGQLSASAAASVGPVTERPRDWCLWPEGTNDISSDANTIWNGSRSVIMSNIDGDAAPRMKTLWQAVSAASVRGKRVELAGHFRTATVGEVVLFIDANTEQQRLRVAFETKPQSLELFPLVDSGWKTLSVVAEIAPDVDRLYYGVSYRGSAPLWVDDFRFDLTESPATPPNINAVTFFPVNTASVLPVASNLDFERTSEANNPACERVRAR